MRLQCKCHGVSGACELRICWRAMPKFRDVGELLMEKFNGATEVKLQRRNYRKALVPMDPLFKHQTNLDLVYLKRSPDFCSPNPGSGTPGTTGRECNKTSVGIDGCDLLCCHRGYKTTIVKRIQRCKCKFHWCCHVKCKECSKKSEINTCL